MKTFKHSDGNTYTIEGNILYACELSSTNTSATLPEGVEIIADATPGVFEGSNLATFKTITPLRRIGRAAFAQCSQLQSFEFSEGLEIGDYAFAYSGLRQVNIDCDFKPTGNRVFAYCKSLRSVSITAPIKQIAASMFQGCESLESATLPGTVTDIGQNAFYGCQSLADFSMPPELKFIGSSAFFYCKNITNVGFTEALEHIGACAFEGLGRLDTLVMPGSVRSTNALLGRCGVVFPVCNNLQFISLPTDCSYTLLNGEVWVETVAPNFNCEVIFRPLIFFPRISTGSLKTYYSKLNRAEKNYFKHIYFIFNRIANDIDIDVYAFVLQVVKHVSVELSPIKSVQLSANTSVASTYVPVGIQGEMPNQNDIERYKSLCRAWEDAEIKLTKAEPDQSSLVML